MIVYHDEQEDEGYTFSPKLKGFLENMLHFHKLKTGIKELENAGRELSKEENDKYKKIEQDLEKIKKTNLDRMKRYNLDKHIFRSMANLVLFFETLKDHPELRELFEKDIKELFGYIKEPNLKKYVKEEIDNEGKMQKVPVNIIECIPPGYQNIMVRFLQSLLTWDTKNDPNNFRLGLIGDIQQILYFKIINIAKNEFFNDPRVYEIIRSDIDHALAWAKMYNTKYTASEQGQADNEETSNRPVRF